MKYAMRTIPDSRKSVFALLVLCVGLALLLASCGGGSGDDGTSEGTTTVSANDYGDCSVTGKPGEYKLDTVDSGVLTVGTVLPLPGYFNGANPGDIKSGYEYCLAAQIAYSSGLRLRIENVSFDKIIAGRMQGLDMVMAGIFITPEREKVVDFSIPYYTSYTGVLVRKDEDITESNIHDASIGVLAGALPQQFAADELGVQPKTFTELADLTTAVVAKRIDVAMNDTTSVLSAAAESNGALEVVGQYKIGGENGIVLPKDSPNTETVDEILKPLIKDGTVDHLVEEYLVPTLGGGDPSEIPIWKP